MLLQSAIGDAYGAGFEFEAPEIIAQENHLTHYKRHAYHCDQHVGVRGNQCLHKPRELGFFT